jgi:hypothetical protein
MTTFPRVPRLLKGSLVLIDPDTGAVLRIVALQYNPGTLTRTIQVKGTGENRDRSEALRLTGPPVETYQLEAEIDAADQLEFPDQNQMVVEHGILPQLAALEAIVYPDSNQLVTNNSLAASGMLEIVPPEAPLTVFVWSKNRVLPVRLTEFSVTEEAFDPNLNPIRAKANLSLRVLTVDDLGFDHRGGTLYLTYHQQIERFASQNPSGALGDLGLTKIF